MAIFRLVGLKVKPGEQARVRVEELLTEQSVHALVDDLKDEGMWSDAFWYQNRLREMRAGNQLVLWDQVCTCEPMALNDPLYAAYRRGIRAGSVRTYACLY